MDDLNPSPIERRPVRIETGSVTLEGDLALPEGAHGLVIFAHGSGSSRLSPRNRHVAARLNEAGLATLLLDLLTPAEEAADQETGDFRFDIALLAARLRGATQWAIREESTRRLKIGYFGASTGAAAALTAAADDSSDAAAVVSRGGRPDLARSALQRVAAPTLLIVGGHDAPVIRLNTASLVKMQCEREFVIVPGATHLFEEPGALDEVAQLARQWFLRHLGAPERRRAAAGTAARYH
jgi:putative phosphoribosyl transferase